MNLRGLIYLADFGERFGLGLWNVTPNDDPDGDPLLLRALRFLLPAALGETAWPYPQITPFDAPAALYPLVLRAVRAYPDAGMDAIAERLASLSSHV
jgi:hypothetical protein